MFASKFSDGELDGEFVERRLLASFLMVNNQHTREFLMVNLLKDVCLLVF